MRWAGECRQQRLSEDRAAAIGVLVRQVMIGLEEPEHRALIAPGDRQIGGEDLAPGERRRMGPVGLPAMTGPGV